MEMNPSNIFFFFSFLTVCVIAYVERAGVRAAVQVCSLSNLRSKK